MNIFSRFFGKQEATFVAPAAGGKEVAVKDSKVRALDMPMGEEEWKNQLGTKVQAHLQKMESANTFVTAPDSPLVMDSAPVPAMDAATGWSNGRGVATGWGGTFPEAILDWYAVAGMFPGFSVLAIMAQHWLIDKCCSLPGEDAVRNGYELSFPDHDGDTSETLQKIAKFDKKLGIKDELTEAARFANMFGIRICIFVVESNDPNYYQKPFNLDGVTRGSYRGISQVDSQWCMPELTRQGSSDPATMSFYEPEYWIISGHRYHKSHLVILRGPQPPDILKPQYLFGGISMTQRLAEHVYDAERTAAEAPRLAMAKRTTSMKVDLSKVAMKQKSFEDRLLQWIHFRDNFSVKVLGKDEEISETDTSLSELSETIMTQYQIVASISKIPIIKLMGTSPKGFSSGADELTNYHEALESIQSNWYDPMLDRHYAILTRSLFGKGVEVDVAWQPVASASATATAEINKNKTLSGIGLITAGVITPDEERDRLRKDKRSGYTLSSEKAPGPPKVPGGMGGGNPALGSPSSQGKTGLPPSPHLRALARPPSLSDDPATDEEVDAAVEGATAGRNPAPERVTPPADAPTAARTAEAAGVVYYTPDRVLLLRRSDTSAAHPGEWAFAGGHVEDGETNIEAAIRESTEEIGHTPSAAALKCVSEKNGFESYSCFYPQPFNPVLNDEHSDYMWAQYDSLPSPLHPGVAETINEVRAAGIAGGRTEIPKHLREKLAQALTAIISEGAFHAESPQATSSGGDFETPRPDSGTKAKPPVEVAAKTPTEVPNAQKVEPDSPNSGEPRRVDATVSETKPELSDPYSSTSPIKPSVEPSIKAGVEPDGKAAKSSATEGERTSGPTAGGEAEPAKEVAGKEPKETPNGQRVTPEAPKAAESGGGAEPKTTEEKTDPYSGSKPVESDVTPSVKPGIEPNVKPGDGE